MSLTVQSHHDSKGKKFPADVDQYIAGLCVGSLAAAAVSSSQSLTELMAAGVDAVRVALHVGLQVAKGASLLDNLATETGTPALPWSYIIPEAVFPRADAAEALSMFSTQSVSRPRSSTIKMHDDCLTHL